MIGAIIVDIISSRFEFDNNRSEEFELFAKRSEFTDNSALTIAVVRWLLGDGPLVTMLVDDETPVTIDRIDYYPKSRTFVPARLTDNP